MEALSGMDAVRLLCAYQVLTMPSGMLGGTHKAARAVIAELVGVPLPEGAMPKSASLMEYLAWHGVVATEVQS
ncbi:MAG: hypothetical protein M3Q55_09280 [Acidobacteriota bacterium]|nr:hypothetical protein [Acidobacteriota bacterium]